MAYVSAYGNYGEEELLHFDAKRLTDEQWGVLSELPDYDKMPYVKKILQDNAFAELRKLDEEFEDMT